jgi:hypothetical protein
VTVGLVAILLLASVPEAVVRPTGIVVHGVGIVMAGLDVHLFLMIVVAYGKVE